MYTMTTLILIAATMENLPVSEYWEHEVQGSGIYLRREFLRRFICNALN
jgi:hypothetical protein